MWAALGWGMVHGHIARGPDGGSGGIRSYGSSDALEAGRNEGGIHLRVKVEGTMREMVRQVEEEESGL